MTTKAKKKKAEVEREEDEATRRILSDVVQVFYPELTGPPKDDRIRALRERVAAIRAKAADRAAKRKTPAPWQVLAKKLERLHPDQFGDPAKKVRRLEKKVAKLREAVRRAEQATPANPDRPG